MADSGAKGNPQNPQELNQFVIHFLILILILILIKPSMNLDKCGIMAAAAGRQAFLDGIFSHYKKKKKKKISNQFGHH
jgi:hypothetical protein